jgi:hypothetical protein
MLSHKLEKSLVEGAIQNALMRRYKKVISGFLLDFNVQDGVVNITTTLPNGNWCGIKSSLRGFDELYKWLDSIAETHPKFNEFLMGWYAPTEQFGKDIDWTIKVVNLTHHQRWCNS